MARHRGRHSRGTRPDADGGELVDAVPPETASTEGASSPPPELGLTTVTVGPGVVATVAAVLEAAPDPAPAGVAPPATALPPVSRSVPMTLSPPISLSQPPATAPLATSPRPEPDRRHRRWPWVALVVIVAVAVVTGVQLGRPVPGVALQRTLPVMSPVSGATPALPWPAAGEAAVAVPQLGVTVQSGPEAAVPIASLTKIMTGYVTLLDHPLAPGAQGPLLVMTSSNQTEAVDDEQAGATNVPVQPGEQLSERQLLDGLLVHSANNFADILARWDAGTIPAFVAKMNAAAAALGMTHTHYADASGLDQGTAGTAGDELLVTRAAMAIPTFAAVVSQPTVILPVTGVLYNYVTSVGTDGVVGVKSGFTQAAMGCLVLAGERTVAGRRVLVLAAVTGQPGQDPLHVADGVDVQLLDAVAAGLREVPVVPRGVQVGAVTRPWARTALPVVASEAITLLAWPGQQPRLTLALSPVHPGVASGARVGSLSASIGRERVVVPVHVVGTVVGPSVGWRLQRS